MTRDLFGFEIIVSVFHFVISVNIKIPTPDYDGASLDPSYPGYNYQYPTHSDEPEFISKKYIKQNMSREMKEVSKDIHFRSKQLV